MYTTAFRIFESDAKTVVVKILLAPASSHPTRSCRALQRTTFPLPSPIGQVKSHLSAAQQKLHSSLDTAATPP